MKGINLISSFIKDPKSTSYDGKDDDEIVKILLRQSIIVNYFWILISLILIFVPFLFLPYLVEFQYQGQKIFDLGFIRTFVAFWYLFVFGYSFQNFINWYFEALIVTNKKIIDLDNSCTHVSETTIRNVQDVTSKVKGIWGVVFNIGDIFIQTSAEQNEFEFRNVDNPSKVRDDISDLVAKVTGRHHDKFNH